jgi:hypothetical protein
MPLPLPLTMLMLMLMLPLLLLLLLPPLLLLLLLLPTHHGADQDATKSKVPDFKHKDKEANKALWVDNKDTPTWVLDTLKRPAYISN